MFLLRFWQLFINEILNMYIGDIYIKRSGIIDELLRVLKQGI